MEPIVVVGAGPTGLMTALVLARWGVPSVVLEAEQAPSGVGSKAICVQRDVLSALDRLGVADELVARGVSWTLGRTYFRDREVFQTRFPEVGAAAYPPFVNVSQAETEQVLFAAASAAPEVTLRFGCRVAAVEQDEGGVTARVQTGEAVRGSHLVACDGGRSPVRELLGVGFPGHSHDDRFLIADIRADLPFPDERRFFFDPPFNPGRQVLVHPQADGVWRIDWQVPSDVDVEEERRTGRLDQRIRAVVGDADYEVVWLSSYRFHQRVATRWRVGRVFLAGDAAHLMAPFGARGMNSGIMDAENLAWKLALVRRGEAPDALLDTYEAERRAAAEENVRVTDATMRFMVPRDRLRRAVRNGVLRASLRVPALRPFVNSGRLAEPFQYEASPIIERPPDPAPRRRRAARLGAALLARADGRTVTAPVAARPGALAPDAPVRVPGRPEVTRVRQLFGAGFVALWFPAPGADPPETRAETRTEVPTEVPTGPGLPPLASVVLDDPALRRACAVDGSAFLLVRPDGYVAARRDRLPSASEVRALLTLALGGTTVPGRTAGAAVAS